MHNTPLLPRKKGVSGIREGDDSKAGEREGKIMYTMGATLSHCTKAGRASTFASSYCPN